MDIVAYAVPFFLLSIVLELGWGFIRKNNTYRINDSINSLSMGMISTLSKLVFINVSGYVFYQIEHNWAIFHFQQSSVLHWVAALLIYDICYYWFHRISHERQFFWGAHVAHHQSEDYNLSTALRQTGTGLFFTWVFYIPCFFFGIPLYMYVTIASGHLVYQFWIHTQHIPKLGFFEWFMITPSNHRAHHAQNAQYVDKNYGGLLVIWDRLFGTYAEEDESDPPIYGLRTPLNSWNPVWANIHIYVGMVQDAFRTKSKSDRFRVLWSRNGWRPADVAEQFPRQKTNLDNFQPYGPKLDKAAGVAVLGHYFILLSYFMWFSPMAQSMTYSLLCSHALLLVLYAVAIGSITGTKTYATKIEIVRVVLMTAFVIFGPAELPIYSASGLIALSVLFSCMALLRKAGRSEVLSTQDVSAQ